MPLFRPPISHAAFQEVLDRLARGERLKAICADPTLPAADTVIRHVRNHPGYAAAYRQAQAKGDYLRKTRFDPAAAAEIVRRLNEGERIARILTGPPMPSRATYRLWRINEPDFGEAVFRAKQAMRIERAATRRRSAYRHFDRSLADRIIVRVAQGITLRRLHSHDPELPCHRIIERWRREDREFDSGLKIALGVANRDRQRTRVCNPKVIDRVMDRLIAGDTLAAISRRRGMPSLTSL